MPSPDAAFSETDSLYQALPVFKRRGHTGKTGVPEKVITNSLDVQGPKRAELHFFDINIVAGGDRDDAASTVSGGSRGANKRENRKVRKEENRRLIEHVVDDLQSRFRLVEKPLYAYDDEKTLVFVNCKRVDMDLRQHIDISHTEQGPRNPDGTPSSRQYSVTVTYTKNLQITGADFVASPADGREKVRSVIERLQALNLILREALTDVTMAKNANPNHVVVSLGDKVFANTKVEMFRDDRGNWRSIWCGFTAALRVARDGLVLTADQTFSVFFHEGFLHDLTSKILKFELSDKLRLDKMKASRDLLNLTSIFRGRQVEFRAFDGEDHPEGVIMQFLGPADETEADRRANREDPRGPSVIEKYSSRRNSKINYPNMPAIEVRSGSQYYKVPAELVYLLPGQRYQKPLTKMEQANFIRTVGKSPNERIGNIDRFLALTQVRRHALLRSIGMEIGNEFIEINARVLPMPEIEYKALGNNQGVVVTPNNGTWNQPRSTSFHTAAEMSTFLVMIFPNRGGQPCTRQSNVNQFLNDMEREAKQRGMYWRGVLTVVEMQDAPNFQRQILDLIQQKNPTFLFGIFERGMDRMYADFKCVMDNQEGIPSQGLLNQTVERNPRGCIENILQKINIKLGGVNNILTDQSLGNLRLLNQLFMIVGISLSHGTTKSTESRPSYAAFVASMDSEFTSWSTEVKVTNTNEALVQDFTDQMVILLESFRASTSQFPQVVIVYRDGVTRTHETMLHNHDLRCIKEAFRRLGLTETRLVFIVVNKMHRTRFFRMPVVGATGERTYSRENIPPGLIVDQTVVDPYNDDFYLASHRGMLGTSRPIRYHILVNEDGDSNADDIQELTMSLCYIYQRCTIGVSIPAPLYYANLAAARCSVLAEGIVRQLDSEAQNAAGGGDRGRGGVRGGRGRGRGRGGSRVGFSMDNRTAVDRLTRGIMPHDRLKQLKRLSYI